MSGKRLVTAVGAAAATAFILLAAGRPAAAQDARSGADEVEEIVVTGIRASQRASIDIKRNAVGVVDSIVAEDLGKLPDQNVAEALQRIPGVTIERNRGEGRYISVRGLGPQFNAVTVNGRTLPTDNNGREFSFDVVPSEIIIGADVYKSPQANVNGASIGATVDIRTLRPLDQPDVFSVGASIGSTWAELSDSYNPEGAVVASWRNDGQTLGAALALSYVDQETRDDEFTIGAGHVHRSSTDSYYDAGGVPGARLGPDVEPFQDLSMPSNLSPFFFERSKELFGLNTAVQYQPSDALTLTFDGFLADADITEQQTGLAYDFAGGVLVDQVAEGGEAVYQAYEGGFVDQIVQYDQRNVTTSMLGFNAEWIVTPTLTLSFDVADSLAEKRNNGNNLFTTIRRKNVDLWFDRRSGSPIYDYGFESPDYPNAPTSPEGVTAHYYIWAGGADVDDEITEFQLDAEWAPGENATIYGGLASQNRTKSIMGDEMPFGEQCAYCNSDRVLPESLFSPTNRNFFDGSGGGDIIRDWLYYDPSELVDTIDEFAGQDGITFDPAIPSPSGSSVVDEDVLIGFLMADIETSLGDLPLAVNLGVRIEYLMESGFPPIKVLAR